MSRSHADYHTDYEVSAESDAKETVRNFIGEILEQLTDKGEASDDLLNDYPNGEAWHHESHTPTSPTTCRKPAKS